MSAAHCSANCVSCGVAFREAKNATNSLSSKSLFPDKSIKKRRRCINLSRTQGLGCPLIRISNTNTHAGWYISTHWANVSGEYIHLLWISCCRPSNESKPPSFEFRRIVKKYPIKYVRLNGKSHKPLQRYRKFLRKREFMKNSYVGICYLCTISPDLGCIRSGL